MQIIKHLTFTTKKTVSFVFTHIFPPPHVVPSIGAERAFFFIFFFFSSVVRLEMKEYARITVPDVML